MVEEKQEQIKEGQVPEKTGNPGEYKVGYKKPPKEHQFKKGQISNPAGNTKGNISIITEIKKMLLEIPPELRNSKDKKSYLKLFLKAYFKKILMDGDTQLMKDLIDRIDGPPRESLDLSSGGEPLGVVFLPMRKKDENKQLEEPKNE